MHLEQEPGAPAAATIDFEDFLKVDIRLGTVVDAQVYAGARHPSLKLRIDFGPAIGVKKSCAQIASLYAPDDLVGRQIAAVVNFPPRQVGKAMSEVLTLGFADEQGQVVLFSPDSAVPDGARLL